MIKLIAILIAFCSMANLHAQTDNIARKSSSHTTNSSMKQSTQNSLGKQNGHEWVDLGLSVKWATCNVGSSTPSGFGSFFSWGEIKTKSDFTPDYRYEVDMNEYFNEKQKGTTPPAADYDIQISKDAATTVWGSEWRMPTKLEFEELKNKCRWIWKGNGYEVIASNGNSIFLPAGGWMNRKESINRGTLGVYWTATFTSIFRVSIYSISFHKDNIKFNEDSDCWGHSIRPVTK